jgi:hypothetical protein
LLTPDGEAAKRADAGSNAVISNARVRVKAKNDFNFLLNNFFINSILLIIKKDL